MYERLTDRARKILSLANQEAHRFNHDYVGTEHILLGLVIEGSGVGANVIKSFGVDLRKVRLEVEKHIKKSGPDTVISGKLPQTPRAKKVIEYAMEEARLLDHDYVGSDHLLLGLIREKDGVAGQVLRDLGVDLEVAREEIVEMLKPSPSPNRESVMAILETASGEARKSAEYPLAAAIRKVINEFNKCPECGQTMPVS